MCSRRGINYTPFQPKSVLSVYDGFHDFLDVNASIQGAKIIKTEEKDILLISFKDVLSNTIFHLKSEASSYQILDQYKNDACIMKIRSAKVLQRRGESHTTTTLYKNFDSILYFNDLIWE